MTLLNIGIIQATDWYGGDAGSITATNSTINQIVGYGGDVVDWEGGTYRCSDEMNGCYAGDGSDITMIDEAEIDLDSASFDIEGGYAYQDLGYGTDGDDGEVFFSGMNYFSTIFGKIGWSSVIISEGSLGNLATGMKILNNSAYLNPASIPELDIEAKVVLNLLGWNIVNPVILVNGEDCRDCVVIDYDDVTGVIIFTVTDWSNYTVESGIIGTAPNVTNFPIEDGSTNFSALDDYTNVTNMTLANENGTIQFPEDYSVNASGEDYDSNVVIGEGFVSVNISNLDSSFNHSVNITLNNVTCDVDIYYSEGFYTVISQILDDDNECTADTNPSCTNVECDDDNDTVTFTISHFSGFAVQTHVEPADTGGTTGTTSDVCRTEWVCTEWSECINGKQTRTCEKEDGTCRVSEEKPSEEQSCTVEEGIEGEKEKPSPVTEPGEEEKIDYIPYLRMAGIILAVIAGLAIIILGARKAVIVVKKAGKKKVIKQKQSPLKRARKKELDDWYKGKKSKKSKKKKK